MRFGLLFLSVAMLWPGIASANQLAQIYNLAKQKSAQFAAAKAALRAGQEAYPQARASILPSITANASASRIRRRVKSTPFSGGGSSSGGYSAPFTDTFDSYQYGVQLKQPIFDWSIPARLRQGKARVKVAQLQFLSAKQTLVSRVISGYLAFLSAADELQTAKAQKRALAEDLKRAKARYKIGSTAVTALREAQAASDLAVTDVINAQTKLDEAREQLRQITTHWYQTLPGLTGKLELQRPDPASAGKWVDIAMRHNLDYLAAVRQADIAEDTITRQQSGYLPDLDIVAGYTSNDASDYVLGQSSSDASIGLQATWQLFSGGANVSKVREARAKFDQAKDQVEATRRQSASSVRNAYRNIMQGISRVHALRKSVRSAKVALKATKAGRDVGSRTEADVLTAQKNLFQSRSDFAKARYQYLQSVVALKLHSGVLSARDLKRLDARLAGSPVPADQSAKTQE